MQLAMRPYLQHNSDESAQEKSSPQELSLPAQHAWQAELFEHACISAEHTSDARRGIGSEGVQVVC